MHHQLHVGALMLLALPMDTTECLEILHTETLSLQHMVMKSSTKHGYKAVLRAKNNIAHAPAKMETLASAPVRQRMMGLVIISIQSASKLLVEGEDHRQLDDFQVDDFQVVQWAEKYVSLAEALLFSGMFEFAQFVEMKACARLLHSVCYSVQGQDQKALWVLSESLAELGLDKYPKIHSVVLLNIGALLSKLGRHQQSFEVSEAAFTIIQGKLGGKAKNDDW